MHSDLRTILEAKLLFLDPDPYLSERGKQMQVEVFNTADIHELRYMLDQAGDMLAGIAQAAAFLDSKSAIQHLDQLHELSQGQIPGQ